MEKQKMLGSGEFEDGDKGLDSFVLVWGIRVLGV